MPDAHKNFAISAVATAPSPATSGTSLVVTAGHGTRFPTPPFNATVWPTGATPNPTNAEIVRVTAISTDTLTITRAQESTTARSIVVGDQIAATITAKTLTDAEGGSPGVVLFGTAAPTTEGVDGDWYRRGDNLGTLYRKISGAWVQVGAAGNWLDFQGGSLPAGYKWAGSRSVELDPSATQAQAFPTNSNVSGFAMSSNNPTLTVTNGNAFNGKFGSLGGFAQFKVTTMPGSGQTLRVGLGLDGLGSESVDNLIPSVVINNAGLAQIDAFFTTNIYQFPVAFAANHSIGFRVMGGGCFVFHVNASGAVLGSVFVPQNLLLPEIIGTYALSLGIKGHGTVTVQNYFLLTEAF